MWLQEHANIKFLNLTTPDRYKRTCHNLRRLFKSLFWLVHNLTKLSSAPRSFSRLHRSKSDLLASLQTVKIKYRAAVLCVNENKSKKVDHVSRPYSNIQNTPLKSKCCFSSHKRERFTLSSSSDKLINNQMNITRDMNFSVGTTTFAWRSFAAFMHWAFFIKYCFGGVAYSKNLWQTRKKFFLKK